METQAVAIYTVPKSPDHQISKMDFWRGYRLPGEEDREGEGSAEKGVGEGRGVRMWAWGGWEMRGHSLSAN